MSASSVASVGVASVGVGRVCSGWGRVGPVREGPVVRAECRVGAPVPWDGPDDGEDYDPRVERGERARGAVTQQHVEQADQGQEQHRGRGQHVVDVFRVRGVRSRWGVGRVAAVDCIGHGRLGDQPVTRVWAWRWVTAVHRAVALVVEEHRSFREVPASTLVVVVDSRPVSGQELPAEAVAALRARGLHLPTGTPTATGPVAGSAGAGSGGVW